ncbi:hypothetical protein NMG60_11024725 [Bertholletia excelsa]
MSIYVYGMSVWETQKACVCVDMRAELESEMKTPPDTTGGAEGNQKLRQKPKVQQRIIHSNCVQIFLLPLVDS